MPLRAARPPKTFPLLRMFATKKITRASVRTTRVSTYKVDRLTLYLIRHHAMKIHVGLEVSYSYVCLNVQHQI